MTAAPSSLTRAVQRAAKGLPIWKGAPSDWAKRIATAQYTEGDKVTGNDIADYLRDKEWLGCEECNGTGIAKSDKHYQYLLFGGREEATYQCGECDGTGLDPEALSVMDESDVNNLIEEWPGRPPRRGRSRSRKARREKHKPLRLLQSRAARQK